MKYKDISEVCSRLFKLYKTREEFIEMLRFNSALISNYYLEPLYKELDYVNQGRIYDDSSEITNEFSKFHNSTFPYLKEDERIRFRTEKLEYFFRTYHQPYIDFVKSEKVKNKMEDFLNQYFDDLKNKGASNLQTYLAEIISSFFINIIILKFNPKNFCLSYIPDRYSEDKSYKYTADFRLFMNNQDLRLLDFIDDSFSSLLPISTSEQRMKEILNIIGLKKDHNEMFKQYNLTNKFCATLRDELSKEDKLIIDFSFSDIFDEIIYNDDFVLDETSILYFHNKRQNIANKQPIKYQKGIQINRLKLCFNLYVRIRNNAFKQYYENLNDSPKSYGDSNRDAFDTDEQYNDWLIN